MSNYKRNEQGKFRNADQQWNAFLNKERSKDVYGDNKEYYGDNYRNPNRPVVPVPYPENSGKHQLEFHHRNQPDENFENYGRGGYYGSTYDQETYNRQRSGQRQDWDDGRGGWWEKEETGLHKGKGPRSYKRSDERIKEDVNDRLYDDPFIDASDIEVSVSNCEVTLVGWVTDRNAKRRAEDIGEAVSGVINVENRLRIRNQNTIQNPDKSHSRNRTIGSKRSKIKGATL